MRVELMPGIASISGTLCKGRNGYRLLATTRKAPTTNPNRMHMYFRHEDSYKRSSAPSEKEIAARTLFAKRQAYVKQLLDSGKYHSRAEAWIVAKQEIV